MPKIGKVSTPKLDIANRNPKNKNIPLTRPLVMITEVVSIKQFAKNEKTMAKVKGKISAAVKLLMNAFINITNSSGLMIKNMSAGTKSIIANAMKQDSMVAPVFTK